MTVVRSYESDDQEALIALWSVCELTQPWNDPKRDIDRKLAKDRENLLVALSDGRLVGSVIVGYDGHRGWVNYLGVHPDYQRQGIGQLLMSEAECRLTISAARKSICKFESLTKTPSGSIDGLDTPGERLNFLYNRSKHAEKSINGDFYPEDSTLCLWLYNDGLKVTSSPQTDGHLTFLEMFGMLRDLGKWADRVQDPATLREKVAQDLGTPESG